MYTKLKLHERLGEIRRKLLNRLVKENIKPQFTSLHKMSYMEVHSLGNPLQVIVLSFIIHVAAETTTITLSSVVQVDNAKHSNNYEFTKSVSGMQCCFVCNRDPYCKAASYSSKTSQCELSRISSSNLNTQWLPEWTLYRIQRPSDKSHFVVDTVTKDWHTAKADCEINGGHLFDAKTEANVAIVVELLEDLGVSWIWLGASDLALEGQWVWSDGSLVSDGYSAWSWGEPNDHSGSEDCAQMNLYTDVMWNDFPCFYPLPSVCQYD